jgi:hypothetical protein
MAVRYLQRDQDRVDLGELLDRLLTVGIVARGSIVLRVAGIDLLYVELSLLVSTVEKLSRAPTSRSLQ